MAHNNNDDVLSLARKLAETHEVFVYEYCDEKGCFPVIRFTHQNGIKLIVHLNGRTAHVQRKK